MHAAGCLGLAGVRCRRQAGWLAGRPRPCPAARLPSRPDAADAAAWPVRRVRCRLARLQRGQQAQRVVADFKQQVASQAAKVQLRLRGQMDKVSGDKEWGGLAPVVYS